MHTFYESVGFSKIVDAGEMEKLMRDTVMHFDKRTIFKNDRDFMCGEFVKNYADHMGLTVVGEFDREGNFHPGYVFPFFYAKTVSMKQIADYEKHSANDSYGGICEDPRIGTSIIFYLSNLGDYMVYRDKEELMTKPVPICYAALAKKGTIVLPIYKTPREEEEGLRAREEYLRLVSDARDGNEEAIEALTEDDMNNYSILSKRVQKEDILSIVDTYFQPYGIECDIYNICGNVLSSEKVQNSYTGENVWKLQIEACDVYFDLCINENPWGGGADQGKPFSWCDLAAGRCSVFLLNKCLGKIVKRHLKIQNGNRQTAIFLLSTCRDITVMQ